MIDQKKIILMLETFAEDFGIPAEALSKVKESNDGPLAKAYLLCFLSGFKWQDLPDEIRSSAPVVTSWYMKKLSERLAETDLLFTEIKSVEAQTSDLSGKFDTLLSDVRKIREPGRFSFRKDRKAAVDPVVRQQTYDIILADYLNNPKFSNEAKQVIFEGWEADDPLSTIRNYAQPEFDVDFMKKVREALLKRPK